MRVLPTLRRARALLRSDPAAEAAAAASRPNTIFGRRDVAVTPWASICAVSIAILVSTLLRDPAGERDALIVALASGGTVLTAFLARMQYWRLGLLLRNSVGIYLIGCASMFGALVFFAMRGDGLATPFFMAAVPTAGYIGLVIPDPWRRVGLAVMVVATLAVQAVGVATSAGEAMLVTVLVVAGWAVGVLGSHAHADAARTAEGLARYDHLSGTLSRRGFLEQLEWHVQTGAVAGPAAVLLIDLDDFKRVNDSDGHAAGDAVLAWVGRALAGVLPDDAEVGRLGGDEFGVLLPAATPEQATAVAVAVRERLSERIVASVGVATCAAQPVTVEEVLRAGDSALYESKRAREVGVHAAMVHPDPRCQRTPHGAAAAPPLSSAAVRRSGQEPAMPDGGVVFGWMLAYGLLCAVGLGAGAAGAMLVDGGLTSPIVAVLFLWVFFQSAILPQRQALTGTAVIIGWWLAVAAVGPVDALWVAPFQFTVLAASCALGSLGHRALGDLTSRSLELAHTDPVTDAQNRLGFDAAIASALDTARATDTSFALLALDLDDFKAVNDRHGHAAGDELLRRVVGVMAASLPAAATVCRTGGDEFVAIVPGWNMATAEPLADQLGRALEPVARASVGHAVCPYDGGTAERLMQAADGSAYAQKRHRADQQLRRQLPAHLDVA